MLILHAAWRPTTPGLVIWAERDGAHPGRARPGSHPFAATAKALVTAWPTLGDVGVAETVSARLPTVAGQPVPSSPALALASEREHPPRLRPWSLPAIVVGERAVGAFLATEPGGPFEIGDDLHFWRAALHWVFDILAGGRYLPTLTGRAPAWQATWQAQTDLDLDHARGRRLAAAMPPACRAVARRDPGPLGMLTHFVHTLVDAFARDHARFETLALPQRFSGNNLAGRWLWALSNTDRRVRATAAEARAVRGWAQPRRADAGAARLCLRLDPPEQAQPWTLRFLLQSQADPSLIWPADQVWQGRRASSLPEDGPDQLLTGLGLAARLVPAVERGLHAAAPTQVDLTVEEAGHFVLEGASSLQQAGIGALIPKFDSALRLKAKVRRIARDLKGKVPVGLTADTVLHFDWQISVGDTVLSAKEFAALARLKSPLVEVRGQWVLVDPEHIRQAQRYMASQAERQTLAEALPTLLRADARSGLPIESVEAEGSVGTWLATFTGRAKLETLKPPAGLRAVLRPYQQVGFSWLVFLRQLGLGACLADDMGLGKTIQTLSLLVRLKQEGETRPHLIICPTSVVANWAREAERFAPGLRVLVHHGLTREKDNLATLTRDHDLVLTSYALLVRDQAQLSQVAWGEVILDEAQNVKNAETKQARAARELTCVHRIALTGTPVENRLSELWSLFHFINPGYLGGAETFRRHYSLPIERDQEAAPRERLKRLIAPFVLRRLKTDPTVISDLPAKHEMKVYVSLSAEQASLYQAVVDNALKKIESSTGIERRGLILAAMLRFKQVCNHPAHFLADGSALPGRSGKLDRLTEMLDEVRAAGERALIFTQFSEMGTLLQSHLRQTLGADILYLHGGTPAGQRAQLVERFQSPAKGPLAFVLSLKAGGTGLNLTAANHVFHYDRWWNPAVENQATDRAFRIGQTRRVQVHKFICAGTIEDKIDALIESKLGLANAIVGASESWVTELSTRELRELFALRV